MTRRPLEKGEIGVAALLTTLLLSAMWGGNVVGIKMTLEALPPLWSAFWRMLLGLPVLWIWARAGGVRLRPAPGEGAWLAILGALFAVQIMLLNLGVQYTSAAYSATLINAAPLFTNLIAHYFVADDRLSPWRVVGLLVAFSGVAAVMVGNPDPRQAGAPLLGNVLVTLSATIIGGRMVYTQRLVQSVDSTRVIFWQVALALPLFLAAAALFEPPEFGPFTFRATAALAFSSFGVVGVAFILWVRLLEKHPPGLLSVFVFPTPLFGVLFSALLFGEKIGASLLFGVLAVAFGILIVTWEKRRRNAAERLARA